LISRQSLSYSRISPTFYYLVHKSPPLAPILSQINPAHTSPSYFSRIHFDIILSPAPKSSQLSLSFWISHQNPPRACYMPRLSHPPWLNHFNFILRRVQVTKLLITQLYPTSCHLNNFGSKYSPQHPVLKRPQSVFLL
jgi:hypothetical protein